VDDRTDEHVAPIPSADTDAAVPAGVDVERVRAADRRLARLAVRRTVAVPVAVATRIVAELGACNDGRQCERSQERDDFA